MIWILYSYKACHSQGIEVWVFSYYFMYNAILMSVCSEAAATSNLQYACRIVNNKIHRQKKCYKQVWALLLFNF